MLLLILDVGSNIFQKNHILSHTPMGGGVSSMRTVYGILEFSL